MTAVRIGVVLSAAVLVLGAFWTLASYFSHKDIGDAELAAAAAILFGGIALALIWLAVFVAVVIQKGIRVLGG
jgi:hypothetical protein